jgi:O-antigen/teichoic acid export membrane protein
MTNFYSVILKAGLIKVIGIGLTFIFLLIVAQYSSDIDYGIFATIFSAATILGFAFVAGQHVIIMRYWPSFDENVSICKADSALRWSFKIVVGVGAIGTFLLLGAVATYKTFEAAIPTLWLHHIWPLVFMSLAFSMSEFAQGALRARGEVLVSLSGREIFWRLFSIGLIILIGPMSGGELIFLSAATLFIVNIFQLWIVFRRISPPFTLSKVDIRDMRRRSRWIWLGTTVGPLVMHSGTILVGIALGPTAAGAFFAADRIAKLLSIALIAVNQAFGPQFSREYHAGRLDNVQRLMTMSAATAGAIAIVGALALFLGGRQALALFSESYTGAYGVLIILTIGQVVNALCGPNTMLMDMTGMERANTIIMSITGGFSLAIIFLGAKLFGVIGAATGATLTLVAWNLAVTAVIVRKLNIMPLKIRN